MAVALLNLPTELSSISQQLRNEPAILAGLTGLVSKATTISGRYSTAMKTNGGQILTLVHALSNASSPDTSTLATLSGKLQSAAADLRSTQTDIVNLQTGIHGQIEPCRGRKKSKESEIAQKAASVEAIQGRIDGMNEQINTIDSDARDLDQTAGQLDGRADDLRRAAKRKRKRGLLGGIVGIALAPFTGGASLVVGAAIVGINTNDADSCSSKARSLRDDASKKRENANSLRSQVQSLNAEKQGAQTDIDRLNTQKDELTSAVTTLDKVTALLKSSVPVLNEIITNMQDIQSVMNEAKQEGDAFRVFQAALSKQPHSVSGRSQKYIDKLMVTWGRLEQIFHDNGVRPIAL